MGLRVCVLGSGSKGNCTYVATEHTAVLIDAGLSGRAVAERLAEIGASMDRVQGICLSHEHSDHTAGLRILSSRHRIPVYANSGTLQGLPEDLRAAIPDCRIFTSGSPFAIGDLAIEPFSVPHDAYDPVGFVISNGELRAGVVTDMGAPTHLVRERLKSCCVVVVEANHDERMLQAAPRPWHLKQRILGRQGHLSNEAAAMMLADIAGPSLHQVFLAHISHECNCEELALQTARDRLAATGSSHVRVSATFADRVSEMWAG